MSMNQYRLADGNLIPIIGLGTHRVDQNENMLVVIDRAISAGYSMIDTAQGYGNEIEIGNALSQCGVNRSEIYIVSKLDDIFRREQEVIDSFEKSLENLRTEYIDLFLIHAPVSSRMQEKFCSNSVAYNKDYWVDLNCSAWLTLEGLVRKGLIKSLGVSNFGINHIEEIRNRIIFNPVLNQLKTCIGHLDVHKELFEYCKKNNILVCGYSPFGKGGLLENGIIAGIANKYNRTPAQVVMRFLVSKGFAVVPRASKYRHLQENISIYDFELSEDDNEILEKMRINEKWAMSKNAETGEFI